MEDATSKLHLDVPIRKQGIAKKNRQFAIHFGSEIIYRSYVEFVVLHSTLVLSHPIVIKKVRLDLPPLKGWMFSYSDQDIRDGLQVYLNRLLQLPDLKDSLALREFLGAAKILETTPKISQGIRFGQTISLLAFGGHFVRFRKRSTLSRSQEALAIAAGVSATILTGILSTILAFGAMSSAISRQFQKDYFLVIEKKLKWTPKHAQFTLHPQGSDANRMSDSEIMYGDVFAIHSVSLKRNICLPIGHLDTDTEFAMASAVDEAETYFRFVPPPGQDPSQKSIGRGSQVLLQVAAGSGRGKYFSNRDGLFVTTIDSPVTFEIQTPVHHIIPQPNYLPNSCVQRPIEVKVLTYNTWLMPDILTSFLKISPCKSFRSRAIPKALPKADIVLFNEAFCSRSRRKLVAAMKELGYPYETKTIGAVGFQKALDSGVFAMSRYPLHDMDFVLFGSICSGDDAAADKGVLYIRMQKEEQSVHVFSTHLQAWDTPGARAARTKQLQVLSSFIESKKLPPTAIVLVAGDLNVDKTGDIDEYNQMLDAINCSDPPTKGECIYSFDAEKNLLASKGYSSDGTTERLDYVLWSNHYRVPTDAFVTISPITAEFPNEPEGVARHLAHYDPKTKTYSLDLSDHFPVLGTFYY